MKRKILLLCVGICFLFLLCACAGEAYGAVLISARYGSEGTAATPSQAIEIYINTEGLSKTYDGKPAIYPTYTSNLDSDPRVDYFWYKQNGDTYVQLSTPPTFVGDYKLVVKTVEDGTSTFVGEATALFSITPFVITPLARDEFRYSGASVFTVENVPAVENDKIGYAVTFEHCNVGAPVSYVQIIGERAENYVMHPDYTARILPKVLDLSTLDALSAAKVYDGTDLVSVFLDQSVHGGFLSDESSTLVLSTGIVDVCDVTEVSATVRSSLNSNYAFEGALSLRLAVAPAPFTPPATVPYCAQSEIALSLPTGVGEERLSVTLRFEGKDAGSVLSENGVSFTGEGAENYCLTEGYTATILPCVLDLSALSDHRASKLFDATNRLTLHLTHADFAQIPEGETFTLEGTVGQIGLCTGQMVSFRALPSTNGNFTVVGDMTLSLTVEKAVLKLSGALSLAYNGMHEHPLSCTSEYVRGVAASAPVGLMLVFEGAEPGAALLGVKVFGENAQYYTLDLSEFSAEIRAVTLRLNATKAVFVTNGESTRKLCNNQTYLLTTVAQGDDVYVLLTFSSAEAGAVLVSAELCGKDADKYVLDTAGFAATLI